MIYTGLDISTNGCGISIMEDNNLIHVQTIISDKKQNLYSKKQVILTVTQQLIKKYKIEFAILESVYVGQNRQTCITLAETHGIIESILILNSISFIKYPPQTIKKQVLGHAKAGAKKLLNEYINKQYNINVDDNSADAIACVLCHLKMIV